MRHDHVLIKHVHRLYGERLAKGLQTLPFFYISEEVESNFASSERRNDEGFKRQYPEFVVDLLDYDQVERLMPFPMVCIMDHEIGWHSLDWRGGGKWHISICLDNMLEEIGINVPVGTLFGFELTYVSKDSQHNYTVDIDSVLLIDEKTGRLKDMSAEVQDSIIAVTHSKAFNDGATRQMTRNLLYFLSFFKWAQTQHMVEVRNKPTKQDLKTAAKGKKPWLRSDLSHYIYLDSPKTIREGQRDSKEGGGRVRGHPRRHHFKTLRHPRYKNHPLYMVPDAIPVKAAWVGPIEWTVGDTIYTVRGVDKVSDKGTDGFVRLDEDDTAARGEKQHTDIGQPHEEGHGHGAGQAETRP